MRVPECSRPWGAFLFVLLLKWRTQESKKAMVIIARTAAAASTSTKVSELATVGPAAGGCGTSGPTASRAVMLETALPSRCWSASEASSFSAAN